MNRKLLYVLLPCLVVDIVHAQTTGELDTLVVTSSFMLQNIAATGRNITIVDGERLAQLPIHSLDELLRYLPGVEVQTRGAFGAQADIVLRGGTFQQVLVLVDGTRLNDPNSGHFTCYIPIAPEEIDRVEILKGGSSSIYGSEAVGGVIHIITKTFASGAKSKGGVLRGQVAAGEYDLRTTSIGGGYSNGATAVSGGLETRRSDGPLQRGVRGYFDTKTASLSFSHRFSSGIDLSIRSAVDTRNFAAQNFYTGFLSDTSTEGVKTWWNQLQLGYHEGNLKISLNAGYKTLWDHFRYAPSSTPNENYSQLRQLLALFEWNIARKERLVTGTQVLDRIIHSNDRGNHRSRELAQFLAYSKRLGRCAVDPSVRLVCVEGRRIQLIPQINLSYAFRRTQFRASGGRTLREADFTERYNNFGKNQVMGGRIGDPELGPETSWNYECGADYFIKGHLKLSTSFFQRYHRGLIDYVPTPYNEMPRRENLISTGSYALAKNIASVITTGGELDLQYAVQLEESKNLWATAGMLWLKSRSSSGRPSLYLSSHAKWLTNFSLQYDNGRFNVGVNGLYKYRNPQAASGMVPLDAAYFVANIKLQYAVCNGGLNGFLEVDNFTAQRYSDLLGAQLPGRWVSVGVRVFASHD